VIVERGDPTGLAGRLTAFHITKKKLLFKYFSHTRIAPYVVTVFHMIFYGIKIKFRAGPAMQTG